MASNKQKVIAPKQAGRKASRPRKSESATPTPGSTAGKIKLKLNFKPSAHENAPPPVSAYQFPLSAPPFPHAPEKDVAEDHALPNINGQGMRRGARQRTKTRMSDMIFGSEMDQLITSSATISKTNDEDDVQMVNSPPTIISMRAPARYDSSNPVRDSNSPPPTYAGPIFQDICDILNTLRSASEIQVDLPNMFVAGGTRVVKPYTAAFLTQLYIQCYENQLWHFCDLVADTWIRAFQKANRRSHRSKNERDHVWRKNVALERMFAEKKKGFKKDVFEFGLDVQDPDMDADATDFNPERLHELYAHTAPKCGARLLWADAMALCGRKMETEILRRSGVWPNELFFDVMCTSLRMVGRKLTLKIEEKYEGAWCRYHEHVKHGLPCYRKLAWQQKGEKEEEEGDEEEEAGLEPRAAKGEKRGSEALGGGGDEQGEAKRVRFDAGEVIDFGDIDAEGESEEED